MQPDEEEASSNKSINTPLPDTETSVGSTIVTIPNEVTPSATTVSEKQITLSLSPTARPTTTLAPTQVLTPAAITNATEAELSQQLLRVAKTGTRDTLPIMMFAVLLATTGALFVRKNLNN